jgi:hypothetical protein
MDRKISADDRRHLAKVATLDCELCRFLGYEGTPAEVHHVRARHGWGRSSHKKVTPLCPIHHRDPVIGIHGMGRDQFTEMYGISEMELLELTNERVK